MFIARLKRTVKMKVCYFFNKETYIIELIRQIRYLYCIVNSK